MKRWILKKGAKSIDGLVQENVDVPEPGPGEVRVRVHTVSLNYRDYLVLTGDGWRIDGDLVPVADGAGVIDAVGEGVTQWSVGDLVTTVYLRDFPTWPPNADMGLGLGALDENGVLAEYTILSAQRVTRAPRHLSLAEASTIPCAAVTAWTALRGAYPLQRGQKVLMLGTGGVSLFAVDLAKAMGAEIFVTSSREDKSQRLKDLGVSRTFDYKADPEWVKSVFAATGGVDKVVNTAGFGSVIAVLWRSTSNQLSPDHSRNLRLRYSLPASDHAAYNLPVLLRASPRFHLRLCAAATRSRVPSAGFRR